MKPTILVMRYNDNDVNSIDKVLVGKIIFDDSGELKTIKLDDERGYIGLVLAIEQIVKQKELPLKIEVPIVVNGKVKHGSSQKMINKNDIEYPEAVKWQLIKKYGFIAEYE